MDLTSLTKRKPTNPRVWLAVLAASLAMLMITPALMGSTAHDSTNATVEAVGHGDATAHDGQADAQSEHHTIARLSPSLIELGANELTLKMLFIVTQLAVILAAAKLLGWLAEMVKIPGVLGELAAGMIIGPFALGGYIKIPTHAGTFPLFPTPTGVTEWPISESLWAIAVLASIVLLFMAGLHTNLQQFVKNLGPASVCAVAGVIIPFFLGAWTVTLFRDTTMWSPDAMFMGAIMVATSVGITARVLSDIRRLDTSEGVTILGGAVVDDVLGILVLAIVSGIARGGALSASEIAIIAGKAFGVWIGITGLTLWLAPTIEKLFNKVTYVGARVGLGLGLALLCSAIAEMFGLAFIIGAYSVGLGLSRTKMAHQLMEDLESVNDFIVPVFFAAMGMLVNYTAMGSALMFGLVISLWAVLSKVVGCGVPALIWFNFRGALRVGMGMLPRGEVALIIAGIGLANGIIDSSIFGVSILMTLVTTIIAPLALVPLFKGGPGKRGEVSEVVPETPITIEMPATITESFLQLLLAAFGDRGFKVDYQAADQNIYQLQRDDVVVSITNRNGRVNVQVPERGKAVAEEVVRDAETRLADVIRQIHEIPAPSNGMSPEPNTA